MEATPSSEAGRKTSSAPTEHRDRPLVWVVANIHGPEWIGTLVALEFLQQALAQAGGANSGRDSNNGTHVADSSGPSSTFARLLALADVMVLPSLNPDGWSATEAQRGRGSVASMRCNARGVDLNRNFPRPGGAPPSWLPAAGSSRPGKATYRGSAPASEVETQAVVSCAALQSPRACVSLHSFMGRWITPKVKTRAEYRTYGALVRNAATKQARRYRRLATPIGDVFTGELEDYLHHQHDVWSVCLEHFPVSASLAQHVRAPSAFWRFNPREPQRWIDNDVEAIAEFLLAAVLLPPPSAIRKD